MFNIPTNFTSCLHSQLFLSTLQRCKQFTVNISITILLSVNDHVITRVISDSCAVMVIRPPDYRPRTLRFTAILLFYLSANLSSLNGTQPNRSNVRKWVDLKMHVQYLGNSFTLKITDPESTFFNDWTNYDNFNGLYLRNYRQSGKCVANYIEGVSYSVSKFHELWSTNGLKLNQSFYASSVNYAFYFIARLRIRRPADGIKLNLFSTIGYFIHSKYIRNETQCRQWDVGVGNYNGSATLSQNFTNLGPQWSFKWSQSNLRFARLTLRKIFKFVATRCQMDSKAKMLRINFRWGSALDTAGGAQIS